MFKRGKFGYVFWTWPRLGSLPVLSHVLQYFISNQRRLTPTACKGAVRQFLRQDDQGGKTEAIRGRQVNITNNGANLGPHQADRFHNDLHMDLRADFILADPQFNISDGGGQ